MMYTTLPTEQLIDRERSERTIRRFFKGNTIYTVELCDDGEGVILSITSTDPHAYLDPDLRPGSRIRLSELD